MPQRLPERTQPASRNRISKFIRHLAVPWLLPLISILIGSPAIVPAAETTSSSSTGTRSLAAGLDSVSAARQMTALEGFQVTLAAGEPKIHQPVAMTIDAKGRVWIAEAYTYPIRAPEGEGRDKIVILEDRDLDGQFESRKVFAEGLNLVSGLEVGFGGVWVGAAPYLLFIPDADQDDRPDAEPQVLLDGFGYQDTHETLNAFNWGPDGWLYGCHGVFTHSRIGKPGTADDERVPMNAAVWRYHPVRHEFDIFSRGTSNPWGVDFNDHGHAFITACVIPHLWHVIQGARYQRQGGRHFNPYIYEDIKTIARHRHYAGDIRDHAWWGDEPETPADTLAAGGGHAHCGAMIYLGDNWPDVFRNQIFMNNVHGNRVNQDRLFRHGSGYAGDRAPDIMLANDRWYRGINLRCGPDGSVYIIDWYDRNACHRANPEIWDRTNGRLYNLAYGEPQRRRVDLEADDDVKLVDLHLSKNDWYVRTARRILQHRASLGTLNKADVLPRLWDMAQNHRDATRKLRAIWTLHAIGELSETRVTTLLADRDENVRSWAIQLALEDFEISAPFLAKMQEMASDDPSSLVRLYLTSALQRLPLEDRWLIARALLQHADDAEDHNLPLMVWYGIEPLVESDPLRALDLVSHSQIAQVSGFIIRRLAASDASLEPMVAWLQDQQSPSQLMALQQMLKSFEGRVGMKMPSSWASAYEQLSRSDNESIRAQADQLAILFGDQRVFPRMRATLADANADLGKRRQALEILVRAQDREATGAFVSALANIDLRPAAIRALANSDRENVSRALLDRYQEFSASERRDAIGTLTSRVSYAQELLKAIERKQVPAKDLHAYHVRQLLSFNNDALKSKLTEVWGEIRESSADKRARITELTHQCHPDQLKEAKPGRGRRLFQQHCANCHRLFGTGGNVGPDITGSNRGNLGYILENMIDPSAVVGKDYQMTLFELSDGRVVSGLIEQESDSAVRIRTLNDSVLIARSDIEARETSPLSMMPEGLLDRLTISQIRDLVAYLASPTQVPVEGTPSPIDDATGRVPGVQEGESLKLLEKTNGKVQAQAMSSFRADRWSGGSHLWWTGGAPGDRIVLEVESDTLAEGLEIALTRAPDYAVVQLALDGQPVGEPIDLYAPQVITSGVLSFEGFAIEPGKHQLEIRILGANPRAAKSFMVGIDWIRLGLQRQSATK